MNWKRLLYNELGPPKRLKWEPSFRVYVGSRLQHPSFFHHQRHVWFTNGTIYATHRFHRNAIYMRDILSVFTCGVVIYVYATNHPDPDHDYECKPPEMRDFIIDIAHNQNLPLWITTPWALPIVERLLAK